MQLLELHNQAIEKSETIELELHSKPIEKSETIFLISRVYLGENLLNSLGDSSSELAEQETPSQENSSQETISSSEEEESSDPPSIDENSRYQQNLELIRNYRLQPQVERNWADELDYVYEVEGDQEFYFGAQSVYINTAKQPVIFTLCLEAINYIRNSNTAKTAGDINNIVN